MFSRSCLLTHMQGMVTITSLDQSQGWSLVHPKLHLPYYANIYVYIYLFLSLHFSLSFPFSPFRFSQPSAAPPIFPSLPRHRISIVTLGYFASYNSHINYTRVFVTLNQVTMDDIAVRLVALNTRTRTAWAYGHNKLNYVGASFQGFPERERASRGVTPLDADNGTSSHAKDSEPEIRLSFSRPPRNISKGWVFGGDQNTCDIYCGEPQMVPFYNIGRQTFSITINKHANVILKHLRNTNRTQVKYGTQKAGDRKEFVWILFPMENEIVVTTANQLKFSVIVTDPRTQTTLHKTLLVQFMKGIRDSMPSIPLLPVDSGTTTADTSLASAPETCTCPFYYIHKDRPLGYGSFGGVFVVMDVSTGINYAGKRFYWGYDGSEPTILASQDHVSHITLCRLLYLLYYLSLVLDARQRKIGIIREKL